MKLGSLRRRGRDGHLVVVRGDNRTWADAAAIAPTLQAALDDWTTAEPKLRDLADELERGTIPATPVVLDDFHSPLPRAFEWLDGSAFLSHVERTRRARGAKMPDEVRTVPLMYQGGSGAFLPPSAPFPLANIDWGLDFEAEIAVVTGDVPQGTSAGTAADHIRLLCLVNDWTLRNLVPPELARGFGFLQAKPATSFGPFAVTPDELGSAWQGMRPNLTVAVTLNGAQIGACASGGMHFSFGDLLAHITRTRELTAGTVIGSGTISDPNESAGVCCLVERRALEIIASGTAQTPYLRPGDTVTIKATDTKGHDIFGPIQQTVVTITTPGTPP